MSHDHEPAGPFGLLAEFETPEVLLEAAHKARAEGYRKLDAYSPFPVHGLAAAIGFPRNNMSLIVLIAGLSGGLGGFAMQWFSATIHYPIDVGGRPFFSWPSFIPITFELTVLSAAFGAVFGMFGLNGLPQPYHPVFNAPAFAGASSDRFFLSIEADDPKYDAEGTTRFLEGLHPTSLSVVER